MTVIQATIQEDAAQTLLCRVSDEDGTALTQSTTSTVKYKVFQLSNNATPETPTTSETSLTVADVMFNTLQAADSTRWDVDTTGYNFAATLPGTCFPNQNERYLVEVTFTHTGGAVYVQQWVLITSGIAGVDGETHLPIPRVLENMPERTGLL